MSRLIESLRVYDGQFSNLDFHAARMYQACKEVLCMKEPWGLANLLSQQLIPASGLYKCRIVYDDADCAISFSPYMARPVTSLKLVYDDTITYDHKFADRVRLENHFQGRGACDDILIIKKGQVTDSSISNVIFLRDKQWFTPVSCLLKGTMRESLISIGRLRECEIGVGDLPQFESCKLINAMLLDHAPMIPIKQIFH